MEFNESFGNNLKYLREQHCITQLQLSRETGIAQSKISRWEAGINAPSLYDALVLSDYYGMTVNEIAKLD